MAAAADTHREWARRGAYLRLLEIEWERAEILKAFPGIRRSAAAGAAKLLAPVRPKRTISPAGRRAMAAGMRRYWATRRAAAKSSAK